jgi:4'-phosphopantetheinyl transferase superfamily
MRIRLEAGSGAPDLELIDATDRGLDEPALKRLAREWPPALGAPETSRSYAFPYALIGWHADRIGVDIERIVPCDERFGRSICTPAEADRGHGDREVISLWCGKEALAKALGDALRYDPRRLESPAAWIDGACGPWRARPLPAPAGYVAWVCWRSSAGG